jgi:hypothetical protein
MKQNIPLRRDGALIRKAKILAAQHGTSLSSLLTRYLEKLLTEEEAYEAARKHAIGEGHTWGVVTPGEWPSRRSEGGGGQLSEAIIWLVAAPSSEH